MANDGVQAEPGRLRGTALMRGIREVTGRGGQSFAGPLDRAGYGGAGAGQSAGAEQVQLCAQ